MITIKLYGIFRKLCNNQKYHSINSCNSIKGVVSYLTKNFPKLETYLYNHVTDKMALLVNDKCLDEKEVKEWVLFKSDIVKLVPAITGAGNDIYAYLLIIVGAILMWFGDYGGTVFQMGVGMLVAGVSQLVFKPSIVDAPTYDMTEDTRTSYGFSGGEANLTSQGNPVPIGYGRIRVGSQVVSAGILSVNI